MNIRLAEKKDYDECVELYTEAFLDYDFSKMYCADDPEQLRKFTEGIFKVGVSLGLSRSQILVMEEDGILLASAQFKSPAEKDFNQIDYVLHGILKVLFIGGFRNCNGYLNLLSKTEARCAKLPSHWYLISYAVNKQFQHRGIGSKMMQEGVLKYIREHGGGDFALVTNSQSNERFYRSNGFETVNYELLHFDGKPLGNWTLRQHIEAGKPEE